MGPSDRCRTFRSIPRAGVSIKRRPVDPHEGVGIVGGSAGLRSLDAHLRDGRSIIVVVRSADLCFDRGAINDNTTVVFRTMPSREPIVGLSMKTTLPIAAGILLLQAALAPGATVLFCPFDSLEGWSVRAAGATSTKIIDKPDRTRCVEISSSRGTVFVSRELPLVAVRGCRVSVGCMVQTEDIVPGPQLASTAKLHLAVQTPRGVEHHSARLGEAKPWHREGFTADVPEDAERVVLNLGMEASSGRVFFDQLLVTNDQRGVHQLDLSRVANAGHGQLGLAAFPKGTVEWEGIPFQIMDPSKHDGLDCLRLKGLQHEDWPSRIAAPIAVGTGASAIYILHGALDGRESSETPCTMWSAWFVGGHSSGLSVFEGRQIGAIGRTEDAEAWQVAWKEKDQTGRWVTFGVTKWPMYMNSPILNLTCRAYLGGAPSVILAVTVVEEPPVARPDPSEFDETGSEWNINE